MIILKIIFQNLFLLSSIPFSSSLLPFSVLKIAACSQYIVMEMENAHPILKCSFLCLNLNE